MADKEEKKPAPRLGGLNSGPGAGRLGGLRTGNGAGPSTAPSAGGAGASTAGGARKPRILPTNFARPKQRPGSSADGAPSTSASVASKSEGAFAALMQAAKTEATWERQRGGRGGRGGRGPPATRYLTMFGGGAGDAAGGSVPRGGATAAAASAGGSGAGRGRGTRRLVKAGAAVKDEAGGGVKPEPMEGVELKDEGWRDDSDGDEQEDPISYTQYYPSMLPHRREGDPMSREPDDPAKIIPPDLYDQPEDYQPLLEELSFLQDPEQNDGRLMLFQLPALLPIAAAALPPRAAALLGSAAAVLAAAAQPAAEGLRPAGLRDVPSGRIGKLLVFESGRVKMQIGDVLLDVDAGIPPRFRQDVAVLSPQSRQCVMLAPVAQRVVCTPNLETLLDPQQPLPRWQRTAAASAAAAAAAAAPAGRVAAAPARAAVALGVPAGQAESKQATAAGAKPVRVVVGDGGSSSSSSSSSEESSSSSREESSSSSSDEEEVQAMDVDAAAAANGTQPQVAGQQQQPAAAEPGKQRQGKEQPLTVMVKAEQEDEEVVSPRRAGARPPLADSVRASLRSLRSGKQPLGGGDGQP